MQFLKQRILVSVLACLLLLGTGLPGIGQVAERPDSILVRKPEDTLRTAVLQVEKPDKSLTGRFTYDSSFSPRKATIRSATIPGWGQIYNKQIWKVPFVYGAIGTTAGIFFYNLRFYQDLRRSYIYKTDNDASNDQLIPLRLQGYSANSLQRNRDIFRQNIDYSVIAFLLAWGLNVVDATVSAHLRQFDVTDDLSLKIRPVLQPQGGIGVGLVVNFK